MKYQKGFELFEVSFILLAVALVIASVYYAIENEKEWDKFSAEHKCEVVERISGTTSTGLGVGPNGQVGMVTLTSPSKTSYKCDDGVIYTR